MGKLTNIKLIVVDMDGTLLTDEKEMDSHIKEVIKTLHHQNIIFTFASGRNVHIMKEYVHEIALNEPYITNNGANMFQEDHCLYESSIDDKDLMETLRALEEKNLPYIAYTNEEVFILNEDTHLAYFLHRLKGKIPITKIQDHRDLIGHSFFKVVVIDERKPFMKMVVNEINEHAKHTHMLCSEGDIYTISNREATKGNTLLKLMKEKHIAFDEVLVFGDNYNDVSMFEVVKYSVAMDNAEEEVKCKATHHTLSNNEHGVSSFIKEWVL